MTDATFIGFIPICLDHLKLIRFRVIPCLKRYNSAVTDVLLNFSPLAHLAMSMKTADRCGLYLLPSVSVVWNWSSDFCQDCLYSGHRCNSNTTEWKSYQNGAGKKKKQSRSLPISITREDRAWRKFDKKLDRCENMRRSLLSAAPHFPEFLQQRCRMWI